MDTRTYCLNGELFYVVSTPNGYFLVTHGGPVGSGDIVGYFGPRFHGGDVDPYGWATKSDCSAEEHNKVHALAWSRVSNPPTLQGQLDALCKDYLGHPVEFRIGEQGGSLLDRQQVEEEMVSFFNSLPEA